MDSSCYAVWCFLVALAGGLVGLVLGNLRAAGDAARRSSPRPAPARTSVISAVAAATASIAHIRAGRVNWRLFAWMAPPSIVGALLGGYVSGVLPERALLLVIAAVLLHSAFELLALDAARRARRRRAAGARHPRGRGHGAVIGLLGGIVGPDPRLAADARAAAARARAPARAVGTNVTVGFCVGVAGAIGHLPSARAGLDGRWRSAPPRRSRARCSARASPAAWRSRSSSVRSPCPARRGVPPRVQASRSLGAWPTMLSRRRPSCCSAWSASTPSTRRATSARRRSSSPACCGDAGFEVELLGRTEARPNLVARLRGAGDGPTLCLLSHVDTVLADPAEWERDPWSGDVVDGVLWGRGALDMKSQTAAEVVAAVALARSGWRPARGDLLVVCVVDEETGGGEGAQWLTEHTPTSVRCDYLLNEGAGARRRPSAAGALYGVCVAEKGVFRFTLTHRRRRRPRVDAEDGRQRAAEDAPLLQAMGERQPAFDVTESRGRCWRARPRARRRPARRCSTRCASATRCSR